MKPSPAFQFYADDFLAGTVDMTVEEVGAYIRLLCLQWNKGGLPNDDFRLALMSCSSVDVIAEIKKKFNLGADGMLRNARLEEVRCEQDEYRRKQSEKGRASGDARRTKHEPRFNHGMNHGSTVALTEGVTGGQPEANPPSSSPSPSTERETADAPQIPPMSRKEFDALCSMRAIPQDCADWFWNAHDGRNWTDATGQIISKVEPLLLNAAKNWRAKQAQERTNGGYKRTTETTLTADQILKKLL